MKALFSKVSMPKGFFNKPFLSPTAFIQTGWTQLSKLPGGNRLFSKLVGQYIPYTGTVNPLIQKIDNGNVVITMQDRRAVRNHLNSVHALALANLGEFTAGLSVHSQLKNNEKAILVKLQTEYLKKARGELRCEATFQLPESFQTDTDFPVTAEIRDKQDNVVSKVSTVWRVRL